MDNRLTPQQQDELLEQALRSQPLEAMPRDITSNVMMRIQHVPPPRPFRLTRNDLALGLVLVVSVGAVWYALRNLPLLARAQMRMYGVLFYQDLLVNSDWLIPLLSFGLAGLLVALTIPSLIRSSRS